jgi:chemotaxis protein MotB
MTFADLMSLLLAFFVLLFSFSELDKQKFKELSGSMREAFGVQREVKVKEPPKGISFIAREFSPGRPRPTPMNVVQQQTTNELNRHLLIPEKLKVGERDPSPEADAKLVRKLLAAEIEEGIVEVKTEGRRVIIRIREKGSFDSGSSVLQVGFEPVMEKIGDVLREIGGTVVVAGHTDNIPINTRQFRSNWELSAARAATVLHGMIARSSGSAERFRLEGHADTRPVESNSDAEGRARNRRVEITLVRDDGKTKEELRSVDGSLRSQPGDAAASTTDTLPGAGGG